VSLGELGKSERFTHGRLFAYAEKEVKTLGKHSSWGAE